MPFLPITIEEAEQRGWNQLDIILVTGDAYVDHPAFGVPLLGRWLESHGFRVGIIAQPDWQTKDAFMALGRPKLFFGVTAGAMDSMVAHYTPAKKLRRDDAYTPGNRHGARPNRATIVYTSRLREAYKDVPIVIGGIEASLRRFAHYDYWEDKVRRSILFDAKADMLIYGMGERPILELAQRLNSGRTIREINDIRGTALAVREADIPPDSVHLPSYNEVAEDRLGFAEAFKIVESELISSECKTIVQQHGDRFLLCLPPSPALTVEEMDALYSLPFLKAPHPSYSEQIPAYDQIKLSITTHRGCVGGCAFCSITLHQGKQVQSRSIASVRSEAEKLAQEHWFRGTITDLGGPTANMFAVRCKDEKHRQLCKRPSCLYPQLCQSLDAASAKGASLLKTIRGLAKVKHLIVSSGIRYDLLEVQGEYENELFSHHVGGLLKVAPEHLVDTICNLMRKPGKSSFERLFERFKNASQMSGKKQHLIPYLMSGYPGCTLTDMVEVALLLKKYKLRVEQVQDFTPTPGTLATCMYHTGFSPYTGEKLHVARGEKEKRLQKALLINHLLAEQANVREALHSAGRVDLLNLFVPSKNKKEAARKGSSFRP